MATVLTILTTALQELNVLAEAEQPSAAQGADGLAAFNRMVDTMAAERLQIYTVTRTTWTIVSGTAAYTVGLTGSANVARPVFVQSINFVDTSVSPNIEYTLSMLTDDGYAGIPMKTQTSTYPTSAYYNPTYPLATLTLWPVPTSTTLLGVIYAPAAIAQFATLATTVALPPGYEEMLVKNLAVRLAPSYGRQIDGNLFEQAKESKAIVKRSNTRLMDLCVDPGALVQGYGARLYDIHLG